MTMRAVEFDRYGPADVLQVRQVPLPVAGANEALVRVHAASVNPIDNIIRSGTLKFRTGRNFPKRTGIDFCGEILEINGNDPHLRAGDRAWGVMPLTVETGVGQGSAAEFVTIPTSRLARSPAGLGAVEAAAISSAGAVAIIALRDKAKLQRGERLLVRGGAGGVGSIAVQLGHQLGAHVTALASGSDLEFMKELGADAALDYRTTEPSSLPKFDVVLDLFGTRLSAYRRRLTVNGRMFCLALRSLSAIAYIQFSRVYGAKRVRFFSASPLQDTMRDLATYVDNGHLRPVVHSVYELEGVVQAQRSVEAGGGRGKRVLKIADG